MERASEPDVSTSPDLVPRDPEFDRPPRPRSTPNVEIVSFYQRLVVNPFLGICVACLTFGLTVSLFRAQTGARVPGFIIIIGLVSGYFLLQYHCLDCGKTGLFHRWRQHACPSILQRWETTNPARLGFPAAPTQMGLWIVALILAAILFVSALSGR
jgi:hypothetical protein